MSINLYRVFEEMARRQPDYPALLGPGVTESCTYAELDALIASVSLPPCIGPGSCVGLHCPSGKDYIVLTYAIWRAGGCVVPIPVELTPGEKEEICRQIALDAVITDAKSLP